jgi:serine/threonine protein kinase
MSPEALAGSPPDPGHDLWSLAVVLYEAIAGVHPWLAGSRVGRVLTVPGPVPAIESVEPDCPKGISKMFERALSPDVRRRPTSSVELQELLLEATRNLGR